MSAMTARACCAASGSLTGQPLLATDGFQQSVPYRFFPHVGCCSPRMRSMNERLATWTHSFCCLGMERGTETDRHQATPAPEASVLLADGGKVRYTQVCLDIGIPRPRGLV